MTETTRHSNAKNVSKSRRHKSAAWKSSLLAAGMGAVVLGSALFSRGDAAAAAASQDTLARVNSTRELDLSQPQLWVQPNSDGSGESFQFGYLVQDDSGTWVNVSPRQGRRSAQRRDTNGFTAQPQFFGPMTRTRGS